MHDSSRKTRNPVPDEVLRHHVRGCLARDLPEVTEELPDNGRTMVVVGSGPSIRELPPIYAERALPYDIFALGGAHDWLIDHGIVPHAWINADPMPMVANYLQKPHPRVRYYITSTSHKFVFDALDGYDVIVWHNNVGAGVEKTVAETSNHLSGGIRLSIAGGSTGATRAPFLGAALGYRKFIFYGVDGSGGHAAPHQRTGDMERVEVNGKTFDVPIQFIHQARGLKKIQTEFPEWRIDVRGGGYTAEVCRV